MLSLTIVYHRNFYFKRGIMPKIKLKNQGFTLIELLIAIAIIGILSAIALPSYQNYTRKAHYSEIVLATSPYKVGIEECFQMENDLTLCKSGTHGVPPNIDVGQGVGLVDSIIIGDNSVINVKPKSLYGITNADDYILTPTVKNNQLIWQSSGGSVDKGYAR